MIGKTLGIYQVTRPLGVGGMGEVWRARDTKLDREVALKLLPGDFADDPERHARFEREAKVLASLNHPNIATLFGLEHLDGRHVLVMELVEGEGLDERIGRGAVPSDEALPIALQIAEALEAAHEKGIVHRDLKPANVRIRPDGAVKVLDFGLAKSWADGLDSEEIGQSPTITSLHTRVGLILGTAGYMSPEQARGKVVDKRADIWAFGVVLYEMLTGRQPFAGETLSDVLAAVLRAEPDWAALPADTPARVRRLLQRCLDRDPKGRLRDIGEARVALRPGPPGGGEALLARAQRTQFRTWLPWAVAGLAVATVVGLALQRGAPPAPPVIRAEIPPPPGTVFDLDVRLGGPAELSPDGRRLVFAARDGHGRASLWVRDLAAEAAVELPGTAGGSYPFWSPDGLMVAYFAGGDLRKVPVDGGPPFTLCPAPFGKGGTWNRDGTIVFSKSFATGLHRVPATGGESEPVTTLDETANENSHRFPQFLPDGRHFLFFARRSAGTTGAVGGGSIALGSLDGEAPRRLVEAPANGVFADGWLLFPREGALVAQRFDLRSLALVGEPRPLVGNVRVTPGTSRAVVTAAATGMLAYQTGETSSPLRLALWSWDGTKLRDVGEPGPYHAPRLSPDGRHAAVLLADDRSGSFNIWLFDLERGARTALVTGTNQETPSWSPDGLFLYFSRSVPPGLSVVFRVDVGAPGREERVVIRQAPNGPMLPTDVSPDGRHLLLETITPESGFDIWVAALDGDGSARPLVTTPGDDAAPVFSPSGRWFAYSSEESGRREVYVASFPDGRVRQQVSLSGGSYPAWHPGGERLVWANADGTVVGAPVREKGGELEIGPVEQVVPVGPTLNRFDAGRDGLLVLSDASVGAVGNLHLVVNWPELLR